MSTDISASHEAPPRIDSFQAVALAASLTVKDVEASLAWYCDVLGFTLEQRHERDGKLRAASVSAGTARLMIGRDDGAKGWDRAKGEGFSLMLTTTQDVDAVAARIREAGGTLASEPTDTPWGMRAFRLVDPDGFKLTISSLPAPQSAENS